MSKERPELPNLVNANTTEVEVFQNVIIRPIIKMQHQLLIAFLESYLNKRKIHFTSLSEEKKKSIIESSLDKDIAFRSKIIGSVLGQFSIEEYQNYSKNSSELNRRIKQIVLKRLQDSINSII
jgi:hypothetical protein